MSSSKYNESKKPKGQQGFDLSTTGHLKEYDAETDPYCPFTRTKRFKKHISLQLRNEEPLKKSKVNSSHLFTGTENDKFDTGMQYMERSLSAPAEKFSKHVVPNTTVGASGITYSAEIESNTTIEEGKSELEVLKCILNREAYLTRLIKLVRGVEKKFKPEVADVLDFIRAASLDVMEAIMKWRESKNDHDAAFLWNGVNYLLKMPSDLDFLDDYKAVRRWIGFPLIRNPFAIPFPLEQGIEVFADRVLDPKHLDISQTTVGFFIGGISQSKLRKKYTPDLTKYPSNTQTTKSFSSKPNNNDQIKSAKDILSPYYDIDSNSLIPPSKYNFSTEGTTSNNNIKQSNPPSFVLNSDMSKLRQAELVILKEEEKFGRFSRDPEGRIMPHVQAFTRRAALELRKDDKRLLEEPSSTMQFAPHATTSDIGIAEELWIPEEGNKQNLLLTANNVLENVDVSVIPERRGDSKSGGLLAPLELKSPSSRVRRPLKPTLANEIDFNRARKKKTLSDRLENINKLREDIRIAKLALDVRDVELSTPSNIKKSSTSTVGSRNMRQIRSLTSTSSKDTVRIVHVQDGKQNLEEGFDSVDTFADPGMRQTIDELNKRLEHLDKDEFTTTKLMHPLLTDEKSFHDLKTQERTLSNRERSRDIERKRRLLTEDEGRRRGPPPNDPPNVYDMFAVKIQRIIRGYLARCYTSWYRRVTRRASVVLQKTVRGWLGRVKVQRYRRFYRAATNIQRSFRGWKSRGVSASMSRNVLFVKAAITIQRIFRGVLGKKRVSNKRALDAAAKDAISAVDARSLTVNDVRELGRRISNSIEQSKTCPYPPDEVLQMLRIAALIIQSTCGEMGLTSYNFLNKRSYNEIHGHEISWMDASKLVNRAERLLRIIRALAFGPACKPPHLLQIPSDAYNLYQALKLSPRWNISTFENMGMGSTFCSRMYMWVSSVVEVAAKQQEFLTFIAASFPDWLPKLYDIQRSIRKSEFDNIYFSRVIQILTDDLDSQNNNSTVAKDSTVGKKEDNNISELSQMLQREISVLKRDARENKTSFTSLLREELALNKDQVSKETLAITTFEIKFNDIKNEYRTIVEYFTQVNTDASKGDKRAIAALSDAKVQVTNHKLLTDEMSGQLKLLKLQCETNSERRKDDSRIPVDVRLQSSAAGEGKALHLTAIIKTRLFLQSAGVRHAKDLDDHYINAYKDLIEVEDRLKVEARKLYLIAEDSLKSFNDTTQKKLLDMQDIDVKGKDQMILTDEELQEERLEDDKEAMLERNKKLQYIPDHLMQVSLIRPRPVLIAMTRDIPGYAKIRMHTEITRLMPGMFVTLDIGGDNMGLDLRSMQSVLDANKSIILSVDHGLTKLTRNNFIYNLEMTIKALIPNPYIIIAMGDDSNKRMLTGGITCGVHAFDLSCMRDRNLKIALEYLAGLIDELHKPVHYKLMQTLGNEVLPPSKAFVMVLEAIFLLQSNEKAYRIPDRTMAAASWRTTQRILTEPNLFLRYLKTLKRGNNKGDNNNLGLQECLRQYMAHPLWPKVGTPERTSFELMHLLASFVEHWLQCEKYTQEKGGLPSQPLNKTSLKGIQAVIIIKDTVSNDNDDLMDDNFNVENTNACNSWRTASVRIVRAALQDMRLMKTVMKVDGTMYNISVYREQERLYFDAYCPSTSKVYMTSVSMDEVPALLSPNGSSLKDQQLNSTSTVLIDPPQSVEEMNLRLIKLLKFEKNVQKDGMKKFLYCKRNHTFLQRSLMKINGHRVLLTSYEASLGELYFTAYIPHSSACLQVMMSLDTRLKLLQNADIELEKSVFEQSDANLLLPYIIDRLRMSPSNGMLKAKEGSNNTCTAYSFKDRFNLALLSKAQGLSLRLLVHGGVGYILTRRLVSFSGVYHVLTVRRCTKESLLRIQVYEPRKQRHMEIRITSFKRKLLLKYCNDDILSWMPMLLKRLKLNWIGEHCLTFDDAITRTVRKVHDRRLCISIHATDEKSLKIKLTDISLSKSFICYFTKSGIIELLHFVKNVDEIEKKFKSSSSSSKNNKSSSSSSVHVIKNESQKSILKNMFQGFGFGSNDMKNEKQIIDPKFFEVSLESILCEETTLVHIINQLVFLIRRVDESNVYKGYRSVSPFDFLFAPVNDEISIPSLETSLRYEPHLKRKERLDFTIDNVIQSRRQWPVVKMEEELNALALAKSVEAMSKIEADLAASEAIDAHIAKNFNNEEDFLEAIKDATIDATKSLLDRVHQRTLKRLEERNEPGKTQAAFVEMITADGKSVVDVPIDSLTPEQQRDILGNGEISLGEIGVKTCYREGKARWHGHVSVKIFETMCWLTKGGVGRRLRVVVFEPGCSQYFEGIIRNSRHLSEVLGIHGQDLMAKNKSEEMVLFIARYRMEVVKFSPSWDGVDALESNPPLFRIEFKKDRMFEEDKITPINERDNEDANSNKDNLFNPEAMRGVKLLRMVRRVSGLLMQLTIFEIPSKEKEKSSVVKLSTNEIDDNDDIPETTTAVKEITNGEVITMSKVLKSYHAPTLRIIGYDPGTKRKSICLASPAAVVEVVGGRYSPYLKPDRRKELARVVGDSLILFFAKGGDASFELVAPWSGASKKISNAVTSAGDKMSSSKSSAERVIKRPGKLFRSALRVFNLECVVSVYSKPGASIGEEDDGDEMDEGDVDKKEGEGGRIGKDVIVNIYANAASQAEDIVVSEKDQVIRLGRPVTAFPEGTVRAAAIRRLCRFFRAELIEDPEDFEKKKLNVELMRPNKGYISEYRQLKPDAAGDDILRPVGVPMIFMPTDTCGHILSRRGMQLPNKDKRNELNVLDYIVTAYTKSPMENPERGLVVKIYEKGSSYTAVLHVGPSELMRLCDLANEPDLIRDMIKSKEDSEAEVLDDFEKGFEGVTVKGDLVHKNNVIVNRLVDIVISNIGVEPTPDMKFTPYITSAPKGIPPV